MNRPKPSTPRQPTPRDLLLLSNRLDAADARDERAAILEFEAGLDRAEAERLARLMHPTVGNASEDQ